MKRKLQRKPIHKLPLELVVATVLHSSNKQIAADKLGIDRRNLFRLMQKEDFRAAYDEAKRMVLEEAINQFRLFAGEAAQTLRDLMREPINPPSARATAARGLLEVLLRAVETQDLAERHERIAKLMQEHAG